MSKQNKSKEMALNIDNLKKIINFNKETGVFTWISGRLSGKSAGSINSRGYINIFIKYNIYQAHRLAWFYVHGEWPTEDIDHINRIKTDNRIKNLRCSSRVDNLYNRSLLKSNKSGHVGVCFVNRAKRWKAYATVNGKEKYIGYFLNIKDAVEARNKFISNLN